MREVIFAVGEDEIGVRHSVVAVGRSRFCGRRNARGPLDRLDRPFRSGEADKTPVEEIQPASQHGRRITCGIGGHEDELDLIRNSGGQFFQRGAQVRHVHRTLIGAIRVAEEQKRDVTLGPLPEIECRTGSIGEDESRLRQRWRDYAAPVAAGAALLGRQHRCEDHWEPEESWPHVTPLLLNDHCRLHADFVMKSADVIERAGRGEGHAESGKVEGPLRLSYRFLVWRT